MSKRSKKSKVYLSERAIYDLLEIESDSIAKWGRLNAGRYIQSFEDCFRLIETHPGILVSTPVVDQLLTHTVEQHVIVCIKWRGDVLVLTIVFGGRDLIAHLDELLPTLRVEIQTLQRQVEQRP